MGLGEKVTETMDKIKQRLKDMGIVPKEDETIKKIATEKVATKEAQRMGVGKKTIPAIKQVVEGKIEKIDFNELSSNKSNTRTTKTTTSIQQTREKKNEIGMGK